MPSPATSATIGPAQIRRQGLEPVSDPSAVHDLPAAVETLIVGAGQAGLTMSYHLGRAGREHLVLDRRPQLGGGWLDRWDDFRLVTPNHLAALPGDAYRGPEPEGFMARDAIVERIAGYAATIGAPVALGTEVRRLSRPTDDAFLVETDRGPIRAQRVVVATGAYHSPWIPPLARGLAPRLEQLHVHAYRQEAALPAGAVLVAGSGQSGVQIAEELADAGRSVFLAAGSADRFPRRYRGRDIFEWLSEVAHRGGALGVHMPTVDRLPDPRLRLAGSPQLSGHDGGHDLDLAILAARGVTVVGHIEEAAGEVLSLRDDLATIPARVDRLFGSQVGPLIDAYIAAAGIDAPPAAPRPFDFHPTSRPGLDLGAAGVSTIIWATGYRPQYGWIELPIFDDLGFPIQQQGVSSVPGLVFLGLHWQSTIASATLFGPSLDGPAVARALGLEVVSPA